MDPVSFFLLFDQREKKTQYERKEILDVGSDHPLQFRIGWMDLTRL